MVAVSFYVAAVLDRAATGGPSTLLSLVSGLDAGLKSPVTLSHAIVAASVTPAAMDVFTLCWPKLAAGLKQVARYSKV